MLSISARAGKLAAAGLKPRQRLRRRCQNATAHLRSAFSHFHRQRREEPNIVLSRPAAETAKKIPLCDAMTCRRAGDADICRLYYALTRDCFCHLQRTGRRSAVRQKQDLPPRLNLPRDITAFHAYRVAVMPICRNYCCERSQRRAHFSATPHAILPAP